MCKPVLEVQSQLPVCNPCVANGTGCNEKTGGNTIIIFGNNYAPLDGEGYVNNGVGRCNCGYRAVQQQPLPLPLPTYRQNNYNYPSLNRENFAFMAKMMKFIMQILTMLTVNNQGYNQDYNQGCSCRCGNCFEA